MLITSPHNPRIKAAARLQDRRGRDAAGLTLIEGGDELAVALAGGVQPVTVFECPELHRAGAVPPALPAGVEHFILAPAVFGKLAYRDNPDGWLAAAPLPGGTLAELGARLKTTAPLIIVCEAVEKPGNLGALLRTADAAGADALIVCDPATDLGNPNVIRASRGAVFAVPVALAASAEALAWLRARGFRLAAATPQAVQTYTDVDLRGPLALAVGAEDLGLSDLWLTQADLQMRIPMVGQVNSLNVSASAAILIYEAVRQRRAG